VHHTPSRHPAPLTPARRAASISSARPDSDPFPKTICVPLVTRLASPRIAVHLPPNHQWLLTHSSSSALYQGQSSCDQYALPRFRQINQLRHVCNGTLSTNSACRFRPLLHQDGGYIPLFFKQLHALTSCQYSRRNIFARPVASRSAVVQKNVAVSLIVGVTGLVHHWYPLCASSRRTICRLNSEIKGDSSSSCLT
jgi:hypothetical protein